MLRRLLQRLRYYFSRDRRESEIIGRDVVEARGGRVVRIDLAPGYSTTELIRRVQTNR